MDRARAARVARHVPAGVLKIAESGVESAADVAALAQAGFDGVLVGETLLRSPDRRAFTAGSSQADRAMWVKICGITSEEDALIAVAMGADAVGFVFAPSPRQMSPSAVAAITGGFPPRSAPSGSFARGAPPRPVEIVNRSGLDAAQLHGNETFEDCGY